MRKPTQAKSRFPVCVRPAVRVRMRNRSTYVCVCASGCETVPLYVCVTWFYVCVCVDLQLLRPAVSVLYVRERKFWSLPDALRITFTSGRRKRHSDRPTASQWHMLFSCVLGQGETVRRCGQMRKRLADLDHWRSTDKMGNSDRDLTRPKRGKNYRGSTRIFLLDWNRMLQDETEKHKSHMTRKAKTKKLVLDFMASRRIQLVGSEKKQTHFYPI